MTVKNKPLFEKNVTSVVYLQRPTCMGSSKVIKRYLAKKKPFFSLTLTVIFVIVGLCEKKILLLNFFYFKTLQDQLSVPF